MLLQMAFKNQVGRGKTDAPGRGGRQITHIDGIKIAPGRQHIQTATAGGAAGAGGDEAPLQGCQQPLQFGRATGIQLRRDGMLQGSEYRTHIGPQRFIRHRVGTCQGLLDALRSEHFQAFAGVTGGAPQGLIQNLQQRRARP
ncbi:hypothetical protein D3C77_431690 [compost metagenome]